MVDDVSSDYKDQIEYASITTSLVKKMALGNQEKKEWLTKFRSGLLPTNDLL